uniref:Uncharacterized protein n=1 Tax=Globodera rostochiensis TaxID=31243 RepID=A0A914HM95_GLORO
MKANVVALVAFLAIFVPPNSAITRPLQCQRGIAYSLEGTDHSGFSYCDGGDQCVEANCTAWDQPGNIYTYWDCVDSQKTDTCDRFRHLTEGSTKSKNVTCHCKFGDAGRSAANLPSIAAMMNRIRCKAGRLDASQAGVPSDAECLDNEYGYCYVAYCAKAKCFMAGIMKMISPKIFKQHREERENEHVQTLWGCSKDNSSCDAFNVAGVPFGNKNFSQMPTTTTTTTTKKTTTKTQTMMTTLKGPILITGKPTTAGANRSSFAIFWTLLVAIGTENSGLIWFHQSVYAFI